MDKILIIAMGVAIVTASVLLLRSYQPTMDEIEWHETIHHVQAGDTLWTIASTHCPDQVDRREWVEEIQALNGLRSSTIHPGQRLTVLTPVKER